MEFLRKHWFDIGGVLGIITLALAANNDYALTRYQVITWLSLASLFFHQLEEYRIAGTFPGMINSTVFKSALPDRYPLNTNTSLYVNVFIGWTTYFLAAYFAEKAVWLGMATIVVSIGNIISHTVFFNIKGRTWYNAGLATCWLLFVPVSFYFFKIVTVDRLAGLPDYLVGIALGIALNVFGVIKLIDWMKDKDTRYIFSQHCLLPKDRKH